MIVFILIALSFVLRSFQTSSTAIASQFHSVDSLGHLTTGHALNETHSNVVLVFHNDADIKKHEGANTDGNAGDGGEGDNDGKGDADGDVAEADDDAEGEDKGNEDAGTNDRSVHRLLSKVDMRCCQLRTTLFGI